MFQNPQILHKYVAQYSTKLIHDGNILDALQLYIKYGAPANYQNYNIYKRIAVEVFGMEGLNCGAAYKTWADLRDVLHQLVSHSFIISLLLLNGNNLEIK